jgi:dTMP kinase
VNGIFITFEGPDGSGKSTQIRSLVQYVEKLGYPYVLTREPGGTRIGDAIRTILLNPANTELADQTEVLLYAANRAQHVNEVILPALKEGKIVLCDRFVDASIAYQGYGLGQAVENVVKVNQFAIGNLKPDRTYLIDISPEVARERMNKRDSEFKGEQHLDRIEVKDLDYHSKVREGFYSIYRENITRICMIDGNRAPEVVFEEILLDFKKIIEHKLNLKG